MLQLKVKLQILKLPEVSGIQQGSFICAGSITLVFVMYINKVATMISKTLNMHICQ